MVTEIAPDGSKMRLEGFVLSYDATQAGSLLALIGWEVRRNNPDEERRRIDTINRTAREEVLDEGEYRKGCRR